MDRSIAAMSDQYVENLRLQGEKEQEDKFYLFEKYEQLGQIVDVLGDICSQLEQVEFKLEGIGMIHKELEAEREDKETLIKQLKEEREKINFD